MTRRLARPGAAAIALSVGLGLLTGCSGQQSASFVDGGVPAGSFQLVAFDTCASALAGLRAAARSTVGPYGFGGGGFAAMERGGAMPPQAGAAPNALTDKAPGPTGSSSTGSAPNYSGTNTHEAGVDEPDIVKTDGRRIVTMSGGVLRVVDAANKRTTGMLNFSRYEPMGFYNGQTDLLLAGDHVLMLVNGYYYGYDRAVPPNAGQVDRAAPDPAPTKPGEQPIFGPRLVLVDISDDNPRVLSEYAIDGGLVDARQVGSIARVVVRSAPRLIFNYEDKKSEDELIAANRKVIDRTPLEAWLPRIETKAGGATENVRVSCEAISRPAIYTGTNLLTILTFDLDADELGRGDPTTVVADGETVYSNGGSLYISSDRRWQVMPARLGAPAGEVKPAEATTEIYKFDSSKPGRPRYVAGGSVPGYLINQYAMSEWDGRLRVATTTEPPWNAAPNERRTTQSGVYVLAPDRRSLKQIGKVDGLGKGERIYAVRFQGALGFVVTFRQTDPLYTIDLRDPRKPAVLGELKITGYSSYLHPIGQGRLIGIGQEATERGRPTGTQVSMFDLSDLTKPRRLAHYQVSGAHSEAEFDPHAFLYWDRDQLLVVPLQTSQGIAVPGVAPGGGGGSAPNTGGGSSAVAPTAKMPAFEQGALVLRVGDTRISELGFLSHPNASIQGDYFYPSPIRRSLVIDDTLWTLSDAGLMATDIATLDRVAWLPRP